jgi:hypothetical protein
MPGSLISLSESGQFFTVQYGDFATVIGGELRNAMRLHLAVLVTAGASSEQAECIADPFSEGALYPDEPVEYYRCRLPVNGANSAALLATEFRWTAAAAATAKAFRISGSVVAKVREAIATLHTEREELLERYLQGTPEERRQAEQSLAQSEEKRRDLVSWQASGANEKEVL